MFKWAQKQMVTFSTRLVGGGATMKASMDWAEKVPPYFHSQ